jgi:hypothetical protein
MALVFWNVKPCVYRQTVRHHIPKIDKKLKFTQEQTMNAQRGSRIIALLFL